MTAGQQNPLLRHPLDRGEPPSWASAWGDSRYGPWVAFAVGDVEYRMFWMPPGTFVMGSPEDEPGRSDREVQHEVTLTRGFWMGATPVTQALWTTVMGADNNPSAFVDPQRPVENVSWEDTQSFLSRLEAQHGLSMRLPTEAEWEYACRAGTTDATYAGPMEILGANNAPVLDAIAWYGGNSGVDFDLKDGVDSSSWEDKQHPHTKAGTRKVGTRRRNPAGLYDMLGNVWEWCADLYWGYGSGHAYDPIGPARGTGRVLRGGSWGDSAGFVRAASRNVAHPSLRFAYYGFRLSRGHGPSRRPGGPIGQQEVEARGRAEPERSGPQAGTGVSGRTQARKLASSLDHLSAR